MGLIIPQEVLVGASNYASYYENLGYEIPKHYDKKHQKFCVNKKAQIKVSVLDLKPNSCCDVSVKCDICGKEENITMGEYTRIKSSVEKFGYEYLCLDCKFDIMPTAKFNVGVNRNNNDVMRDFLIRKLKNYVSQNGYPTNQKEIFKYENKLPNPNLYRKYLGGDLVNWLELCDFNLSEDEKYTIGNRGKSQTIPKKNVQKSFRICN